MTYTSWTASKQAFHVQQMGRTLLQQSSSHSLSTTSGLALINIRKYQTWVREEPSATTVYTNTDMHDRGASRVGNTRGANLSLSCSFLSKSPLFPLLYLCNILSSPSSLPYWSLKMFPGVSFNEANLDGWKPPSQGHFIVTLRWILLSMKRGNIRSLGSSKRPRLSLSLSILTHNANCSSMETIYAPGTLSHHLSHIQTELCDTVGPQLFQLWASLDSMSKN